MVVPGLVTVSVNVVPAGKVRATTLGRLKLNTDGVPPVGGEIELLIVVEKPLLAVSVTVTLREAVPPLTRVSHRRTGMGFAEIENVCCRAGVMVQESGAP